MAWRWEVRELEAQVAKLEGELRQERETLRRVTLPRGSELVVRDTIRIESGAELYLPDCAIYYRGPGQHAMLQIDKGGMVSGIIRWDRWEGRP